MLISRGKGGTIPAGRWRRQEHKHQIQRYSPTFAAAQMSIRAPLCISAHAWKHAWPAGRGS